LGSAGIRIPPFDGAAEEQRAGGPRTDAKASAPQTPPQQPAAARLIDTPRRRGRLLIAHPYLAIGSDRNTRKLKERIAQRNVLILWLIDQAAMIEGVHRRAERRRNLGPLPVEAAGDSRVIRRRVLPSAHSGDKDSHRAQQNDHSRHASNLGWLSTISILVLRAVRPRCLQPREKCVATRSEELRVRQDGLQPEHLLISATTSNERGSSHARSGRYKPGIFPTCRDRFAFDTV
jgi:hypothetical protein